MKNLLTFEDFLNEGYMKDTSRWNKSTHDEFHDNKKKLLKELSTCMGNSKWWIDYGTLLGAVREGDFIKHDNDIDIGILAKDISDELFAKINEHPNLSCDKPSNYDKWCYAKVNLLDDDGKKINVNGKGVFCDIYVYYPMEDFHVCKAYTSFFRMDNEYLDKLVNVTIRGTRMPAPSKSRQYIEGVYGEDWDKPNKGKTHHDNIITTFINKLKSYKYDRKNNKGIVEYTKKHLNELEKQKDNDKK